MKPASQTPISPQYPRSFSQASGRGFGDEGQDHKAANDGGEAYPNVGEEVDGGGVESNNPEDAEPLQSFKTPDLPSREAIEQHRIDHWPYRCWCRDCVEGAGREFKHGSVERSSAAIVSMDYMFVTKKGDIVDELEGADDPDALKVLVVQDSKSKAVFAFAIPRKGIDEKRFAVDKVVESVLWLGYSQVVLKSDNEPAVTKLLKESLGALKVKGLDQVNEEHSPPYDPQANGAVEAAVKQVKGKLKTMKLCLERRIGKRIPPKHPIIAWLVSHCAALIRFRVRGTDGKTPYERVRMRPFNSRLVCFAEKLLFKGRSREEVQDEHSWNPGIFLGMCASTGQYVLLDEAKRIKHARTIKVMPDQMKWDSALIESIRSTPYDEHEGQDPEVVFQAKPAEEDEVARRRGKNRGIYIKGEDIRAFGRTVGCTRCDHEARYGPGRTTKGHSDLCRKRIVAELMKTPEGQRRVQDADERVEGAPRAGMQEPIGHGGDVGIPAAIPATSTPFEPFRSVPEDEGFATSRVHDGDQLPDGYVFDGQVTPRMDESERQYKEYGGEYGGDTADFYQEVDMDIEMCDGMGSNREECHSIAHEPIGEPFPLRAGELRTEGAGISKAAIAQEINLTSKPCEPEVEPDDCTDISMRELMKLWDAGMTREAKELDGEIMSIVGSLGGSTAKYKRERGKAIRVMISEIYSPPRVSSIAKLCPSFGVLPGFALDLTTHDVDGRHWDFDEDDMRERAWKKVREERPMLLIGTPMCTAFSAWQFINNKKRDVDIVEKEYAKGLRHLSFCCELYEYQVSQGRYFLHEHPAQATSWQTQVVKRILNLEDVHRTVGHQCQYGAEAKGCPIKKPTGFMTNCKGIRDALSKTCSGRLGQCSRPGGGQHILCNGRVARMAAIFPVRLCKAILGGLRTQLKKDGVIADGHVGMQPVDMSNKEEQLRDDQSVFEVDGQAHVCIDDYYAKTCHGEILKFDNGEGPFFDDLTKQQLPTELVKIARRKELDYFEMKSVWKRVSNQEAWKVSGRPPITVRWVDVNKGDDEHPEIRSRLVARQIRGANEDPMFAPTPPLEALRTVLSYAATDLEGEKPKCRDGRSPNRIQISLIDISRAYFNAKTDPDNPTYVAFPSEDPRHGSTCGLLLKHMYGTQAAADGWQQEYSQTMINMGFVQGVACPCVFWHKARSLVCSVHGDDFTTAGGKSDLDWFEGELESKYELRKGGRIGPGEHDDKEGRVLNRIVRWTDSGLEYEADPRQVERLIESQGLDDSCKSTVTPGLKATKEQLEAEAPLEPSAQTPYRANGARCNYIGPDRPDAQYAAKEVCRWMSAPTDVGLAALKRLVRFLLGRKRLVFRYPWQRAGMLECYSDTDWAGCPKTRKSTSGGCLMLGGHLLKTWSSTQPSVSLSSGEAEYYGVVKAAGIAIGHQSLMSDLGMHVGVRVWTDSSAAMGICGRSGLGKLRHVQTHTLWVQERVRTGAIQLRKVNGLVNPADLFTKHLSSRDRVNQLVELFNCEYREGRATTAPLLRKDKPQTAECHATTTDDSTNDRRNYLHNNHSKCKASKQASAASVSERDDVNNLSPTHDPDVLPHNYAEEDRDKLFQVAVAPVDPDGTDPLQCICCRPGCKRCFPDRPQADGSRESW